jgi:2-dehydro-3-deoxyphosphogluconate aldolase/(4S)-4-hydroxy-2-oxoglutarate aldolase
LPVAEVTLRTERALESLRRISQEQPKMLAGAGTVLTVAQAKQAKAAGAKFIVSPGFSRSVVDYCLEQNVPVFPGVSTPTEIQSALETGLKVFKIFPIEAMGGIAYLKAVSAPFVGVQFAPSGGITAANIRNYLALKNVVACGGSWMAPSEWIASRQFDRIQSAVRDAVGAVATQPEMQTS